MGNRRGADLALSTARLNRIVEHTWADLTVTVESGCRVGVLQDALRAHGQRVAMDPLWPDRATVGGVLSTNDTAALRLRFGGLRDLIIGTTIALPDGTIARSGGKVVKNVAGYDLSKLVTGAFGTLGVITSATFKLHLLPQTSRTLSATVADASDVRRLVLALQDSQLAHTSMQVRFDGSGGVVVDLLLEGTRAGVDAQTDAARRIAGSAALVEQPATVWQARQQLWAGGPLAVVAVNTLSPRSPVRRQRCTAGGRAGRMARRVSATGAGWLAFTEPPRLAGGRPRTSPRGRRSRRIGRRARRDVIRRARSRSAWGEPGDAQRLMSAVKREFDPKGTSIQADSSAASRKNQECMQTHNLTPCSASACTADSAWRRVRLHLWGQEMDSPRGRIYLMQLKRDGALGMTTEWVRHFDTCLGCMACMPACPSGVDYGQLIEITRAEITEKYQRQPGARMFRRMLFATLPHPARMRAMRWPLAIYQRSGLQALIRRTGLLDWLPSSLKSMEALMPVVSRKEATPRVTAAVGARRGRVGMLLGCVQREFLSEVNAATARVLSAEGYEVVAPREQPCCGALLTHAGEESGAVAHAKRMIDTFERAQVDTIVINAAGCGSAMKEYGRLLRHDAQYAERAAAFSAKCRDVTELLGAVEPRAPRHRLTLRVAYQDACHLQHAQGVRLQPRELLAQIPGVEVVDLPEAAICCGSAGIYNLVEPETAGELGDRKAALIAERAPDVVATGNPGCLLQLQSALARRGSPVKVVHTMQVLDAAIRGVSFPYK